MIVRQAQSLATPFGAEYRPLAMAGRRHRPVGQSGDHAYAVNDHGTRARRVRRITLAGGPVTSFDSRSGLQRVSPD